MAFGIDDLFLVSMMAAGAVSSASQGKSSQKLIQQGRALENAAFETNMAALSAETAQSSAEAMQSLRQNVSQQIVQNAARGVQSGGGSAASALRASQSNFNSDEKTRRLNLLAKEANLRANNVLSGLHTLESETKLGQSLTDQIFKNLPMSTLVEKFKPLSGLNTAAESVGTSIGKKFGFGLNPIGS